MAEREFDLTVFGATGYTGNFVFQNLILWMDIEKKKRRVAIAGRNKDKLVQLLKDTETQLNRSLEDVGVIIADTGDRESLVSMCKKSSVILNAAGPYTFHGEPVIEACLEARFLYQTLSKFVFSCL